MDFIKKAGDALNKNKGESTNNNEQTQNPGGDNNNQQQQGGSSADPGQQDYLDKGKRSSTS